MSSLLDLKIGSTGIVKKVILGEDIKSRLFNLGVYEGEEIKCVLESPFKDPRAYLVKGTSISIRNDDAKGIEVAIND